MTEPLVLADPAPPRRPRIPRLLRQTAFRRYWSAQTVSLFGDQITILAVPLLAVLAIGAGPAEMGYLTAASLLPNLFFSLPAGAWVDRYPRRRQVMIIADLGRAGLLLAVPLLWWADALNLPLLCVVAFLIGTHSVFFEVAHSSLFAALVRRPDYVDANSLTNGSRAMSYVAGPRSDVSPRGSGWGGGGTGRQVQVHGRSFGHGRTRPIVVARRVTSAAVGPAPRTRRSSFSVAAGVTSPARAPWLS